MKIALLGYGKMGQSIEHQAIKKGHGIVLKVGADNKHSLNRINIQQADVAIEFSRPEAAFHNIKFCLDTGVPVISGTTGWLDRLPEIQNHCHNIDGAFLYASNFSIGVNLFFRLNKMLAQWMNQHPAYNPGMVEIHHTQKLDAPSGTAITLANDIIQEYSRKSSWSLPPAHDEQQLLIEAKRIDQVPGTHRITWSSKIDSIEIKHTAHSREGFVLGALMAAEWIIGKKGCFGMDDVLGITKPG